MADNLVDILGFSQPASGNNWSSGLNLENNVKMIYLYDGPLAMYANLQLDKQYMYKETYEFLKDGRGKTAHDSHGNLVRVWKIVEEQIALPMGFISSYQEYNGTAGFPDVPDKNNPPPVIIANVAVAHTASKLFSDINVQSTSKQNILININARPIFRRVYVNHWNCLRDFVLKVTTKESNYIKLIANNVIAYEKLLLQGDVDGANKFENELVSELKKWRQNIEDGVKSGKYDKDKIPACFLPDPGPALPGPPTQTIFGTLNKPAVADNPNIKLPSQTVKASSPNDAVKSLTEKANKANIPSSINSVSSTASSAVSSVSDSASSVSDSVSSTASSAVSSASGTISSATSSIKASGSDVVSKLQTNTSLKKIIPDAPKIETPTFVKDGLGDKWSPDKFKPETIAGNTKIVDPFTGEIGSTELTAAADKLKSKIPNIPKPNFPNLPSIDLPTNFSNADAAMTKLAGGNIDSVSSLNPNAGISSPSTLKDLATGGLVGGGLGAGIGALAGGGKGALIGGLSGVAVGGGLSVGGVGGGILAGGGLGGGIGAALGGGKGALIGAASGALLGGAAAKLASIKKNMPKPKVPKLANMPRIKKVKLKKKPDAST